MLLVFVLKLLQEFPRDLVSLKRAQVLCFYMGLPGLSLSLAQQVPSNYRTFLFSFLSLFSLKKLQKC